MSKSILFYKYHGTGNSFILIDNRDNNFVPNKKTIRFLCDKNFGVGSDGLLLLENHKDVDFEMKFYNPDGSEATFCGNGARCVVAFARYLKIINHKTTFWAKDGKHKAHFKDNDVVLKMVDVNQIKVFKDFFYINTGTHHVVKFVDNLTDLNITKTAAEIRYSQEFKPHGTNVNFVQKYKNFIKVRTYEKGVERETLSCGTGIVASALIYSYTMHDKTDNLYIHAVGGKLKVKFEKNQSGYKNIFLQGNAVKVFKGQIDINC